MIDCASPRGGVAPSAVVCSPGSFPNVRLPREPHGRLVVGAVERCSFKLCEGPSMFCERRMLSLRVNFPGGALFIRDPMVSLHLCVKSFRL